MNSIIYKFIGLVLGSLLLVRCAPVLSVQTDYDREADFDDYQTFYWTDDFQNLNNEESEPLFYNTLVKKRLKQAVQRVMEGKGYTLSTTDPDLLVSAQVVVEERSTNRNNAAPFYPYYFGYYGGFNNVVSTGSKKEGDVVINLIDRDAKQLVWQGYAPGVLEMDTEDRQEELNRAVTMILSNYNHRATSDDRAEATP